MGSCISTPEYGSSQSQSRHAREHSFQGVPPTQVPVRSHQGLSPANHILDQCKHGRSVANCSQCKDIRDKRQGLRNWLHNDVNKLTDQEVLDQYTKISAQRYLAMHRLMEEKKRKEEERKRFEEWKQMGEDWKKKRFMQKENPLFGVGKSPADLRPQSASEMTRHFNYLHPSAPPRQSFDTYTSAQQRRDSIFTQKGPNAAPFNRTPRTLPSYAEGVPSASVLHPKNSLRPEIRKH